MIILALIIHILLALAMFIAVVCLENDCKKIIFWNLIISVTSIFGFIVYLFWFCDNPAIKKNIKTKFEQDEIYKNLASLPVSDAKSSNDTLNFNKRHYSAEILKSNNIQVIDNLEMFINNVTEDIENAKEYIIIDNEIFLSNLISDSFIGLLREKQSMGIMVKCVYSKNRFANRKAIKMLRLAGVRVTKFSPLTKYNRYYLNAKNLICIDGKMAYIYNTFKTKSADKPISYSNWFYKLTGEIVKNIDFDAHLDVSFATQKYYELEHKHYDKSGETEMQYVSSMAGKDFEGIFLKAINDAKKRIVIHISQFVPTPAIKQALVMAILSGIEVKIMIPKTGAANYYSSRAYTKEMAMYGATAYIYDGVIGSNIMVIDDLTYVGNFSLVNLEIRNNFQSLLIVNNKEFSAKAQAYFNDMVNNSYRICKPKNILFKEKIFKKFN